jgi:hypothetical protein
MAEVVGLGSEDGEVRSGVIEGIFVDMMDDMFWEEGKDLGYDGASEALGISMLGEGAFGK